MRFDASMSPRLAVAVIPFLENLQSNKGQQPNAEGRGGPPTYPARVAGARLLKGSCSSQRPQAVRWPASASSASRS